MNTEQAIEILERVCGRYMTLANNAIDEARRAEALGDVERARIDLDSSKRHLATVEALNLGVSALRVIARLGNGQQ